MEVKRLRARVKISGLVQGVFFRHTTKLKARENGLTGWVKNLQSGEVETIFEGEEDKLRKMINWCHSGPPGARIEKVEVIYQRYTGEFTTFSIAY